MRGRKEQKSTEVQRWRERTDWQHHRIDRVSVGSGTCLHTPRLASWKRADGLCTALQACRMRARPAGHARTPKRRDFRAAALPLAGISTLWCTDSTVNHSLPLDRELAVHDSCDIRSLLRICALHFPLISPPPPAKEHCRHCTLVPLLLLLRLLLLLLSSGP